MSYILDALRRADAERELGRVPTLHSPTVASAPERRPGGRARRTAVGVTAALAGLALAGAMAWWAWPANAPSPAAAAPAPAPSAPAAPAPPASPETAAPTDKTAAAVLPLLAPAPPAPAAPAVPDRPATASADAPRPAKPTQPRKAEPAEPAEGLPRLSDLPADVRAQLPALTLSGATYADNPALRLLIANGRVVQEGQEAAPGVLLEAIGPRSAVLNHRGTRFRVPY